MATKFNTSLLWKYRTEIGQKNPLVEKQALNSENETFKAQKKAFNCYDEVSKLKNKVYYYMDQISKSE